MIDYTGMPCPICGKRFVKGDDIVVCPRCGAPYHRACFEEKGDCIFQDLHSAGETWQRPAAPEPPSSQDQQEVKCPYCGKKNHPNALFCDQCGRSLTGAPNTYANKSASPNSQRRQPPVGPNMPPSPVRRISGAFHDLHV